METICAFVPVNMSSVRVVSTSNSEALVSHVSDVSSLSSEPHDLVSVFVLELPDNSVLTVGGPPVVGIEWK